MTAPIAETRSNPAQAERLVVALVLALFAALVWRHAPGYLHGDEPLGADSSSHIVAATTIAQHLVEGSAGWWAPSLNLGFPLAHYYQPLPHIATALLALALGGPEKAALAYKLWVLVLLALAPFTAYVGFRRLALSRTAALLGAIALTTLSTHQESFGVTARHFLFVGLYTLLWGVVFVPLALAEGVRFVQGRGRPALAVVAFTLLFLSHGLLALGLIPVYTLVALFVPSEGGAPLVGRLTRLVALGAMTGALIAAWLLPQLTCSDYFNGWPINRDDKAVDGIGIAALGAEWLRGEMLDLRRWPVLTVLSGLGVVAVLVGAPRDPTRRIVLAGLVVFVVFTAGRETFGSALDWVFPPNSRIEGMARWVAMLDLFLALCVGLGAEVLVRGLRRIPRWTRRSWVSCGLVSALVLGLALPRHASLLSAGLTTFPEAHDHAAFGRIARALALDDGQGRVYTREELGHSSHWAMAYLALLSGKPMTISYAVGGQDSLNFYYLWFFEALDPGRAPALVRLFDIRWLLTRPGQNLGPLPTKFVAREGPYEVSRLLGDYGLFEWTSEPRVLAARTPAEARTACLRWMREDYPRGASFLRLSDPIAPKFPGLPVSNLGGHAPEAEANSRPERAEEVRGSVLQEEAGLGRFRARVRLEEGTAWLVLKVTAHPFWEAEVDGRTVPIYYLSPAFMGLSLAGGEHEVEFTFRAPAWQKWLLALAPLLLAMLIVADVRSVRRRASSSREGERTVAGG